MPQSRKEIIARVTSPAERQRRAEYYANRQQHKTRTDEMNRKLVELEEKLKQFEALKPEGFHAIQAEISRLKNDISVLSEAIRKAEKAAEESVASVETLASLVMKFMSLVQKQVNELGGTVVAPESLLTIDERKAMTGTKNDTDEFNVA